ncbi:TPA: hypothetical protein ACP4T3_004153 [Escherichia coli]
MATTPTNKPIPSEDPRDLKFNAGKIDEEVNGSADYYADRFGAQRLTNTGRNHQFQNQMQQQADDWLSQLNQQESDFQQFLLNSGYQFLGDYENGPYTIAARNQIIRYQNEFWRLNAATNPPYATTGVNSTSWSTDVTHLVSVGDATLRQELTTIGDGKAADFIPLSQGGSIQDAISAITPLSKGGVPDDSSFDNAAIIEMALASSKHVDLLGKEWFISRPIYLPNGCILENGKLSTQAVPGSGFMAGSIFAPGNYHPDYWEEVPKVAVTAAKGQSTLTLADSSIVSVGDIIRLSSTTGILSAGFFVAQYLQLARVLSKSGSTITIDGPIETSLTLEAANADQPSYPARFDKPLFCCRDTVVRNIEVNTWDYWTTDSATYNCIFDNISGKAKGVVYGNTFCKTKFSRINIVFSGRISELAFGSHDTYLTDITAIANPDGVSENVMLGWAESGRRCTLDNFKFMFNSSSNPSTIIRVSGHRDSRIKRGVIIVNNNTNNIISAEQYGNSENSGLGGVGTGYRSEVENILFEDISVFAYGSTAVVCDCQKTSDSSVLNSIEFSKIRYYGSLPSVALIRSLGTASNYNNGVKADISSDIGGHVVLTNSRYNTLKLNGPVTVPNLVASASVNAISIVNQSRLSAKANNYALEVSLSVNSTTAGNVVRDMIYPAGSLRLSDSIKIEIAGSTGGLLGTKTVQVGFIGSDSVFKCVEMAALASDEIYFDMDLDVTLLGTGSGQTSAFISGFISKGAASGADTSGSRVLAVITDIANNNLDLQIRAWKGNSADALTITKMIVKLNDLTA